MNVLNASLFTRNGDDAIPGSAVSYSKRDVLPGRYDVAIDFQIEPSSSLKPHSDRKIESDKGLDMPDVHNIPSTLK